MNLGDKIRNSVKWLALGNIGRRVLEFAYGVVLARLLLPADFGMVVTIQVFTGVVGLFATGGMGQALIRAKEADERDFTAVFTLQFCLGLLIYLGFFIAAPFLAAYLENPLYTDLIRVSTFIFLLRPFTLIRNTWLSRQMDFKKLTYIRLAAGVLTGVLSVSMAWSGMGVWSLTLSGLIASLTMNILLARITPIRLRFNFDLDIMRRHSRFGIKITANDFLTYLRNEAKHLIISKLAGPAFLGLFNKAESLARMPNQLMVPATMQPLFRALSQVQDNLDQTKYMFYRTVTLLMVYTAPLYVLLWWVAESFIGVVYGDKWLDAGAPMRILAISGVFLNVIYPCGVVLAAQNRLGKEMVAQAINLVVILAACYVGLEWGLEGVAWGIVASQILLAIHFYALVLDTLPTRLADLVRAALPGLALSALLLAVLAMTDYLLGRGGAPTPLVYLVAMSGVGGLFYAAAFLYLPIPALQTEAARWRGKLALALTNVTRRFP